MTVAELVYFPVSGSFYDVEAPDPTGSTNHPLFQVITGSVWFYPRVPLGFVAYVASLDQGGGVGANTAVAIPPIPARILSGQLQTINQPDTPGISLLANSAPISAQLATIDATWLSRNNVTPGDLIYDVQFSNLVFAEAAQSISAFAFIAPVDTTPISLTDPNLTRLAYMGPTS